MPGERAGDLAVVIPAYDEADRITATVRAARTLAGLVVVVDDGSTDQTARLAGQAGALVVRHPRRRGKGAAVMSGAAAVARADRGDGRERLLLLLDADLEASASAAAVLAEPVRAGTADMTIARLPRAPGAAGLGLVVGLSRAGIRRTTGFPATQPLSGQRCLTRAAYDAALPLAAGFGLETGLTIDVLRAGMRVVEVDVALAHRVTGRDLSAQLHRGRQLVHVAAALAVRLNRG